MSDFVMDLLDVIREKFVNCHQPSLDWLDKYFVSDIRDGVTKPSLYLRHPMYYYDNDDLCAISESSSKKTTRVTLRYTSRDNSTGEVLPFYVDVHVYSEQPLKAYGFYNICRINKIVFFSGKHQPRDPQHPGISAFFSVQHGHKFPFLTLQWPTDKDIADGFPYTFKTSYNMNNDSIKPIGEVDLDAGVNANLRRARGQDLTEHDNRQREYRESRTRPIQAPTAQRQQPTAQRRAPTAQRRQRAHPAVHPTH